MNKTLLIYHGDCPDGFMAATIFRKAAGPDAAEVEFYAGVHQQTPPDVTDQDVVFVDFSYQRPVILKMARQAKSIRIVDHHISAQKDLIDLPANVETIFDMNQSGAGLAWRIFMKKEPVPKIVLYVQALDLWRLDTYPDLQAVMSALRSYDYDFDLWAKFLDADQTELIATMAAEGQSIQRKQGKDLEELIKVGRHELEIGNQKVPVVNAPHALREAANILAHNHPFAACYCIIDGYALFSLRSDKNGVDVSKIAGLYGGGGHQHAAGFRIPYSNDSLSETLRLTPPQTGSTSS